MSRFVVVGLLLLSVCFPAPVGAVGKTTVDPNALRSTSAEKASGTSGADTTQKVTYEARRKTVVSILEDLTKMTGVTMRAGWSVEDWQVRDRRMNIFAKDVPLSNLMNSIARVMKFKWSKSTKDDGTVSYRLYMDRQILLGVERQRYIEEEKLRKCQTEAREKLLSGLEEAAGMSEDELQKLKTDSPYVYALTRMGWANSLPLLFAEVPFAKQAFLSGESLTLDANSLSPVVQRGLAETCKTVYSYSGVFNGTGIFCGEPKNIFCDGTFAINSEREAKGYASEAEIGAIRIVSNQCLMRCNLDDPDSDLAKFDTNAMIGRVDRSAPVDWDQYHSEAKAAHLRTLDKMDLGEPLLEHSDDPVLSAKVKMKVDGSEFDAVLAALAGSAGLAVVSDSFGGTSGLSFPVGDIEVQAVLGELETECRYNWERHGSILELHDRDWFRKRSAQIPDEWLEHWRKALKENGILDIDELSQIAMLTPEQFWTNILSDDILGQACLGFANTLAWNHDILSLYACLDKQQKILLFTEQGLPLDSVASDRSSSVLAVLRQCSTVREGLKLVGTRKKQGKRILYRFSINTLSGGDTGMRWDIWSPAYYPPASEKPKESAVQQGGVPGSKH